MIPSTSKGCVVTKDLVFFSNPFGFGPTSKAIALMNSGKRLWHDVKIYYVTDSECEQIFNDEDIHVLHANPRDSKQIEEALSQFSYPYVVSSLNRFAVCAAHDKGLPNCFIDSLTWMWKEIPLEYLRTDLYFALNFPGLDKKIKQYPTVIKVPYIIDSYCTKEYITSDILIHIGGCMNPLTHSIPKTFLQILAKVLTLHEDKNIVLCGGAEAVQYIRPYIDKRVQCLTVSKGMFLSCLQHTKHFVTTSGLNASLEAFYYGVPTTFLMPTNLSQWNNLKIFQKYCSDSSGVEWEDILQKKIFLDDKSEREALPLLEKIACDVLHDSILLERAVNLLHTQLNYIPQTSKQKEFITKLGTNGADTIANILKQKWGLS